MKKEYGFSETDTEEFLKILKTHNIKKIIAYGSRVAGSFKFYSDFDFIILKPEIYSLANFSLLKEDFEESNIPFQIDVQRVKSINKNFLELILPYSQIWEYSEELKNWNERKIL
jgi:uncharacterized protein